MQLPMMSYKYQDNYGSTKNRNNIVSKNMGRYILLTIKENSQTSKLVSEGLETVRVISLTNLRGLIVTLPGEKLLG